MMKAALNYIILVFACLLFVVTYSSCTKQDHFYKDYVIKRDYAGRPDSVWIKPGNLRMKLFWINSNDQNIKQMIIYWDNHEDSMITSIDPSVDTGYLLIDDLKEKDYTFNLVTVDASGTRSLPVEVSTSIFGPNYRGTLVNRSIDHVVQLYDTALVYWKPIAQKDFQYTDFQYTDKNGQVKQVIAQPEDKMTKVTNLDWTKKVFIKSFYGDSTMLAYIPTFSDTLTDLNDLEIHHFDLTENGTFGDMKYIDFFNTIVYGSPEDVPEPKGSTIDLFYIRGSGSQVNLISPDDDRPRIWGGADFDNTVGSWTIRHTSWIFDLTHLGVDASAEAAFIALDEQDRSAFIQAYQDALALTGYGNGLKHRTNVEEGDYIWFREDDRGLYVAIKVTHVGNSARELGFDFKVSRP